VWSCVVLCGLVWSCVVLCGLVWSCVVLCGLVGGITCHLRHAQVEAGDGDAGRVDALACRRPL